MADITMCSGKGCKLSHRCYRHNAKEDPLCQSYFVEPPIKDGKCDEFWEDEGRRKKKMNDRNCAECANHTEGGCSSWDCNFKKRIDARQAIAYMKYVRALVAKEENEGNFTNAVDMAIEALENCPSKDSICYGCHDNCKKCECQQMLMI